MSTEERLARLEEKTNHLIGKVDGIRDNIGKIFEKLDDVIKIKERVRGLSQGVTGLYWAFAIVILLGIVIGVWVNGGPK